jgi:hypothetical protein
VANPADRDNARSASKEIAPTIRSHIDARCGDWELNRSWPNETPNMAVDWESIVGLSNVRSPGFINSVAYVSATNAEAIFTNHCSRWRAS